MKDQITKIITESIKAKEELCAREVEAIAKAARTIVDAFRRGNKLLICGNGGSAADSQHMAAEFVGRFRKERKALPAVALTTNTSTLTAIANDYSYDITFSREVEAHGKPGDILFGISTSGSSKNVIAAAQKAKELGLATIALTGDRGGPLAGLCDIAIRACSNDTPRIQESHLLIIHILCELVENESCGQ